MKNSLKALMAIVVGSMGLMAASPVEAGTTADISITVTVKFVSVAVTSGSPVDFPSPVDPNSETVSATEVVITNDGNVTENYSLQLTATGDYTVGTTDGDNSTADTFVLQALFTNNGGTDPVATDFATTGDDVVDTSALAASATNYAWAGSGATGAGVTAGTLVDLFFMYSAPVSRSRTSA